MVPGTAVILHEGFTLLAVITPLPVRFKEVVNILLQAHSPVKNAQCFTENNGRRLFKKIRTRTVDEPKPEPQECATTEHENIV